MVPGALNTTSECGLLKVRIAQTYRFGLPISPANRYGDLYRRQ